MDGAASALEEDDAVRGSHALVSDDSNIPVFFKQEISMSVYRSRSPGAPGNRVSVLAKGPIVKNGASTPVQQL